MLSTNLPTNSLLTSLPVLALTITQGENNIELQVLSNFTFSNQVRHIFELTRNFCTKIHLSLPFHAHFKEISINITKQGWSSHIWLHSFFICTRIFIFIVILRKVVFSKYKNFTIYCIKPFMCHHLSYLMLLQESTGKTLVQDYSLVFYLPVFLFIIYLAAWRPMTRKQPHSPNVNHCTESSLPQGLLRASWGWVPKQDLADLYDCENLHNRVWGKLCMFGINLYIPTCSEIENFNLHN